MRRTPARIHLQNAAHTLITSETAKHLPLETGGVLLGYREDADIIVTHALVVDGKLPSVNRYVRDDVKANELLGAFREGRADDDPIGYIGEWHSHPASSGPSPTDVHAIRATAKSSDAAIALLVHIPSSSQAFSGIVAARGRLGRVSTHAATVLLPQSRFPPLGPLPNGAVRGDGPVFVSYRQSDGTAAAESLEGLLRAAGLVVWRDRSDLRAGTTTDRLEQALTQGLSAAVLVVTPDIVHSEIVRERELPRLLQLDADPGFSLCIANHVARQPDKSRCDFQAPDRLLQTAPARTLADKKQTNMLDPAGEVEIARDLLMHRVEQRTSMLRQQQRPFTIRVQSRPTPSAIDAGEDDLHIRLSATTSGRLPSPRGLRLLQTTLPLISDAVYATGARTVRIAGGAHLSVALALGAALPETRLGVLEVLDVQDQVWTSLAGDRLSNNDVHIEPVDPERSSTAGRERIAVFVSLTPEADRTAFARLIRESTDGFTAAAIVATEPNSRIDAREGGRLSASVARAIKGLAASSGRAEVHLAFHGPYTMAALTGRYLNTLRTVIYEWDSEGAAGPTYTPVIVLEPGTAGGPISDVLV
ncbi:SAVED domain-containing protein [Mycobacterium sp. SMC-8]|uniref:SAVED domain-containing protein n=1 Tax=Mycobacterium sp. SMC-8 TaxID=2857060 RepID=UPI0021B2B3E3|nr:SAVED domain-containing protein [Mycobacterium sp. SMC-8]UXA13660.1 SAVED domain-containing protein [Mycobacterium sp. SMC-8]